jgi:hypothetical protein
MGRQEEKHFVLRTPGCLRSDCGDFCSRQQPGLGFHTGVYSTRVPTANDAVGFSMPKRGPGLDVPRAAMNRHTPSGAVRMDSPSGPFPAFLMSPGQVLPQLSLPPAGPINPRIQGFVPDRHPRVVREIVGQSAPDFFWCPPVTQPGEQTIHKLTVFHSRVLNKP